MQHYRFLQNPNKNIFLVNVFLEGDSLESGLLYFERGLKSEETLLDDSGEEVCIVLLSENVQKLKTVSVEVNKLLEIKQDD